MDIKTAIEQQNKAFIKKLNNILGEPLTILELERYLEVREAFWVAKLAVNTQKKHRDRPKIPYINKAPSKFDRLLSWVKKQRE